MILDIDENQNGIDDRQEKATGGRVGLMTGGLGALGGGTEESGLNQITFNFDGSNIQILMEMIILKL